MNIASRIVPAEPSEFFTIEQWVALTRTLRLIEPHVCQAADRLDVSVKGSSRWPTLSVVKRHGLKRRSVTFRLASDYAVGDEIRWELATEEISHAWIFFYRLNEHHVIAHFSEGQDPQLLVESILQEVKRYLV